MQLHIHNTLRVASRVYLKCSANDAHVSMEATKRAEKASQRLCFAPAKIHGNIKCLLKQGSFFGVCQHCVNKCQQADAQHLTLAMAEVQLFGTNPGSTSWKKVTKSVHHQCCKTSRRSLILRGAEPRVLPSLQFISFSFLTF